MASRNIYCYEKVIHVVTIGFAAVVFGLLVYWFLIF